MSHELSALGEKIFLDRYALKDMNRDSLAVGKTVIAKFQNGTSEAREVATVTSIDKSGVTIETRDGDVKTVPVEHLDIPVETSVEEMFARVAKGAASVEQTEEKKLEWENKFGWLLDGFKFTPGGRILAALGTEQNLSLYNCFSGETVVETIFGKFPIRELSGEHMVLTAGGKYRKAAFSSYGVQELMEVVLQDNQTFYATPDHEWIVCPLNEDTFSIAREHRVKTKDLEGLCVPRHLESIDRIKGLTEPLRVMSVKPTNRVEEVFCCSEPETHTMTIGSGILTGQCFVIPSPKDSRQGVMDCLSNMAEIMSRGGGVGINISSLRPRYAYVKGVNGRSSGAVSWGGLYSFVTGLIEQGGCLPYSALMSTDKGLIRAGDLANRLDAGEVIQAQTHQGLKPFTAVFRNGVKQTVRLVTERGIECIVSKDHKMAVLRDGKMVTEAAETLQPGDTMFSLLGEGSEGDYVRLKDVAQSSAHRAKEITQPEFLDEKLAYLMGYYQANGSTTNGSRGIQIVVPTSRPDVGEFIYNAMESLFGYSPSKYPGDGKCENFAMFSVNLYNWMEENGLMKHGGANAKVPEAIFQSSSKVQAAFFAGWFDADGSDRGTKGGYGIDSISPDAVNGLQTLLNHNGIVSRLAWTVRPQVNWKDIARLTVTGAAFKAKLSAWMSPWSLKDKLGTSKRTEIMYPTALFTPIGVRHKHFAQFWPGAAYESISYGALEKIQNKLTEAGEVEQASKVTELMRTMPDTLRSIEFVGEEEVVDFEVDGTHMLTASQLYSHNSRRGALLLLLADWHPDVLEYINSKRTSGTITNANISVAISDKFMKAVEDDADWELMFPDTNAPNYTETWDGNINKWIESGGPVVVHKTMKAREVWNEIITSAWASAEPGLFFIDRANQMANSYYYEKGDLICCNPCTSGATMVATTKGPKSFKELADAGADVEVYSYNASTQKVETKMMRRPHKTKPNAEVVKVRFSNGVEVVCTPDHGFISQSGEKRTAYDFYGDEGEVGSSTMAVLRKDPQQHGILGQITQYDTARVENIGLSEDEDVYNGMVEDNHNYFIVGPDFISGNDVDTHSCIISANCGEQPLPAWSVCNLGHINLAQFVGETAHRRQGIKWADLRVAVRYATRFLDNVIDATPYFSEGNKTQQLGERRVGLGTIGLAEMLIRLEVAYGSEESLKIINDIYQLIAEESYLTSAQIAAEKGAFPWCNNDLLCGSKFIQSLPVHVQNAVEEHGLRNVTLLTQAPTGTVGTMIGTSTGIEPFYFWSYFRKGRLGIHEEKVNVYKEWTEANPELDPQKDLPSYFVNAMDLSPEGHVKVQAAIQRWVDSAISKTCNVPSTYTVEETRKLYELMHKLGCKGGTIYRDKSRDEQVLNLDKPEEIKINSEASSVDSKAVVKEVGPKLRPRPYKRFGATVSKLTPGGTAHVTMNDDEDGNPFEVFVDIGKGGSDIKAMAEGLGRLCSLILRLGSGLTAQEKVEEIINQLSGIGGQRSIGFGSNRVKSLPDALAQALEEHYGGEVFEANDGILGDYFSEKQVSADLCPSCGDVSLVQIEGCCSCPGCGHSEC